MKRIISIIGLYLSLFIMNMSCKPEHVHIYDIGFKAAILEHAGDGRQFNDYNVTSVFTDDIVFIVSYHFDYVASLLKFNTGSECKAFTRAKKFDNQLMDSTFSLTFDHSFVFNGDTIKPNKNILSNGKIKSEIDIFEDYEAFDSSGADKVFDFNDSFVKNSVFDTVDYKVTFYCRTTDSIVFTKNTTVKFKIKK